MLRTAAAAASVAASSGSIRMNAPNSAEKIRSANQPRNKESDRTEMHDSWRIVGAFAAGRAEGLQRVRGVGEQRVEVEGRERWPGGGAEPAADVGPAGLVGQVGGREAVVVAAA